MQAHRRLEARASQQQPEASYFASSPEEGFVTVTANLLSILIGGALFRVVTVALEEFSRTHSVLVSFAALIAVDASWKARLPYLSFAEPCNIDGWYAVRRALFKWNKRRTRELQVACAVMLGCLLVLNVWLILTVLLSDDGAIGISVVVIYVDVMFSCPLLAVVIIVAQINELKKKDLIQILRQRLQLCALLSATERRDIAPLHAPAETDQTMYKALELLGAVKDVLMDADSKYKLLNIAIDQRFIHGLVSLILSGILTYCARFLVDNVAILSPDVGSGF